MSSAGTESENLGLGYPQYLQQYYGKIIEGKLNKAYLHFSRNFMTF